MGRVLSNDTGLSVARESTELTNGVVGLLPGENGAPPGTAVWSQLEPNQPGSIGADIDNVKRNPISANRQNRKGTIVDLNSGAEFEADFTLSHFDEFIEGFCFSQFRGAEVFDPSATDTDSYTVDTGSVLTARTLVYGRGFSNTNNNGLKLVDTGASATDIPVTTTLVTEASPPNSATVEVAGFRSAAGDLDVTVIGTQVTITSAANIFNEPGLDILPGSGIFFGGDAAINRFTDVNNVGYARIVSIAGDGSSIVIDKTAQSWVIEANTTQEVDFYIGKFVRNVPRDDADFLERSFQFEQFYPRLATGDTDGYKYSKGNYCNSLTFDIPLTSKAGFNPGFVGTDTDPTTTTRKTGADTAKVPTRTGAFNTSADMGRIRITKVDESDLTTDLKSMSITINNNVSPEKVLGTLGAKYMNYGNFEVSAEGQVVFSNEDVLAAIRNNTTSSMDFTIENDDGAIYVDIPALTIGGGAEDFPANESVLLNVTCEAFADPILDTSIGVTIYPYIPTIT